MIYRTIIAPIPAQVCDGGYGKSVMKEGGRDGDFHQRSAPTSLTGFQGSLY
jgi:hypothetical protein